MRTTSKMAGVMLLALAAVLFSLGLTSIPAIAEPDSQAGGQVLTIPAGQTAVLQVRGFCLDLGKPFPTGFAAPSALASDQIRAALNYAVSKDYVSSDIRQVQEAIWFLSNGKWNRPDHVRGQEIVDAAQAAANRPTEPGGTSLLDAIKANNVTVTTSISPPAGTPAADAAYGDGTVTIKNNGTQDVNVYLPLGTVFPPAQANEQRLAVYALAVAQAAPTATTAATNTAAPTNTAVATATEVATATAAATSTTAATATAAATDTPMPAATATPAVALPQTGGSGLPKTGAGSNGLPIWLILFATSLVSLVAGLGLLRRSAAPR